MTDYRNRIKGLEYVNANDLTAHPGNWRDHPKTQVEALKGVLSEVGIAGALLAYRSERQGGALVVIDGHLRKDAAPQKWPVLILDVDDAEADYILSTHDPLAAMATADAGALDALLSSVQSGEAAVQQMLADLAEGAGLYAPVEDTTGRPFEPSLMPEIESRQVNDRDIERAQGRLNNAFQGGTELVEVFCPHCGGTLLLDPKSLS